MNEKLHKLDAHLIGLALAITSGVFYILCESLFVVAPQTTLKVISYMFHSIDITKIATSIPLSLSNVLIGLVGLVVLSYITGVFSVWTYNYLIKK